MKFKITMTDHDGGFIDIDVEAEGAFAAIKKAETDNPGWSAISMLELEVRKKDDLSTM